MMIGIALGLCAGFLGSLARAEDGAALQVFGFSSERKR